MAVRIRLARFGCRNRPFYRVVAADSRSPRDGKHLEILGFYNPLAPKDSDKRMSVKADRVKYWLSVGGQPSETVQMILFRLGVELPQRAKSKARKGRSRNAPPVDPPLEGCFLALKDPEAENEGSNEDGEKMYID